MRFRRSGPWWSLAVSAAIAGCSGGNAPITPAPRPATATPTQSPSVAPSPTATPTATASATGTPTGRPTGTATPSPTPTSSPTPTPHATATPSATPVPAGTPALVDWPMYQFDAQRTGYNPNTSRITPGSLAALHLAWQVSTGGGSQSQPVIATGIAGATAVLIVPAYEGVKAYNALTGALLWSKTFPSQDVQECGTAGVAGTVAYDAALGEVFVVAGNGAVPNHVVVYALGAATGSSVGSVDVTPVLLNGEGSTAHTAISLIGGALYLGTGSDCEDPSAPLVNWRGRLVKVDPSSLTVSATFYPTYGHGANYGGGGIWSWGAMSADPAGNIYTAAGNAENDASLSGATPPPPFAATTDEQAGYAEHLIKLSPNLGTVEDSNYPGFNFAIGYNDLDYSGTPVLFQPPLGSGCSDLLSATQGKGGTLVINDTTALSPPIASYALSVPSGNAYYTGNPAYSPATGFVYAAISSSGNGSSMLPPGMAAIGDCGKSIVWHAQFGPDSAAYSGSNARSAPAVTAGGVAFMGTPCTSNGSGGCTTPGAVNGALWAVDASSGAVLDGGNPFLVTTDKILMAPTLDGDWMWVVDNSGNLYAYTVDPSVPAASLRRGVYRAPHLRLRD